MSIEVIEKKIAGLVSSEIDDILEELFAKLNSKGNLSTYKKFKVGSFEYSLGDANNTKHLLRSILKAGWADGMHKKKVDKLLKQAEL